MPNTGRFTGRGARSRQHDARFVLAQSAAQTLATSTFTEIAFKTVVNDRHGLMSRTLNNPAGQTRLTIPPQWAGGWYISSYFAFVPNTTGGRRMLISQLRGGVTIVPTYAQYVAVCSATDPVGGTVGGVFDCIAGDQLVVIGFQASGGNLATGNDGIFSGSYLGP